MSITVAAEQCEALRISGRGYYLVAFFQDFGPGKGRLTLTCYDAAWSHYWGGMGERHTIKTFVAEAGADYLVHKLSIGDGRSRPSKADRKLVAMILGHLVALVKEALAVTVTAEEPRQVVEPAPAPAQRYRCRCGWEGTEAVRDMSGSGALMHLWSGPTGQCGPVVPVGEAGS